MTVVSSLRVQETKAPEKWIGPTENEHFAAIDVLERIKRAVLERLYQSGTSKPIYKYEIGKIQDLTICDYLKNVPCLGGRQVMGIRRNFCDDIVRILLRQGDDDPTEAQKWSIKQQQDFIEGLSDRQLRLLDDETLMKVLNPDNLAMIGPRAIYIPAHIEPVTSYILRMRRNGAEFHRRIRHYLEVLKTARLEKHFGEQCAPRWFKEFEALRGQIIQRLIALDGTSKTRKYENEINEIKGLDLRVYPRETYKGGPFIDVADAKESEERWISDGTKELCGDIIRILLRDFNTRGEEGKQVILLEKHKLLLADEDIAKILIKEEPKFFSVLPDALKNKKEFVLPIIMQHDPMYFSDISDALRNDSEVKAAMKKGSEASQLATDQRRILDLKKAVRLEELCRDSRAKDYKNGNIFCVGVY